MDADLKRFISIFSKDIEEEHAAIFAGAGLSIGSGYVNWKSLLKEIAEDLGLNIDQENDLIAIAQYHYNKGNNRHRLNQLLVEEFTKKAELTKNHELLAKLPIKTYWTTNYDQLIEQSLKDADKTSDAKVRVQDLTISKPRTDAIVYKMHGDVTMSDEAVLTKDDYEIYNVKRELFSAALRGDLISKTFLFIGFSFDDPNLEYILSRIRILLEGNQRQHYCFFKRVAEKDFSSEEEYHYAQIKQELKVRDLQRYAIKALLINDYSEITAVLTAINLKISRKNIFISGAASTYEPISEYDALNFVHNLSNRLASENYKIVSGFGLGIGSQVINGALEYKYSTKFQHLDDVLILRPFPQSSTGAKPLSELYTQYRSEMVSQAGIAVFLFGNKKANGDIINSPGVFEEFEISVANGLIPIPIGITGYAAEILWTKVMAEKTKYYPQDTVLLSHIEKLGDKTISIEDVIVNVVAAINRLQTLY